ncbi:hypothetical protein L208DRAFT_1491480 [Tricholoma matsutake]|nr:hypothetical protein L208DRAFT_1491480 [Tricholoma matsutake 945]
MFAWYQNSQICIVHLAGTIKLQDMKLDVWFTRGWTLQELLAPKAVKFFTQSWKPLTAAPNDKSQMIDQASLFGKPSLT